MTDHNISEIAYLKRNHLCCIFALLTFFHKPPHESWVPLPDSLQDTGISVDIGISERAIKTLLY
jgi:hypothetical protein